jgi:hypothetical protein
MKRVLFAVAAASIVAGCAQQGVDTSGSAYVEKEYRVGSNLPARRVDTPDNVTTISGDDMERARNSSQNAGAQMQLPKPGAH